MSYLSLYKCPDCHRYFVFCTCPVGQGLPGYTDSTTTEPPPLTESDVRRIVREEMAKGK